jgi:hypothetical protein
MAQWFFFRRFLHFCNYFPLEEDLALYLNKLEFPSFKDKMYQVWLNLGSWLLRRFFKNFSVFLLFCYYLPLERGNPLHLNKLKFPPQGWFMPSLVKIGPVVLEKKIFKWARPIFTFFLDYLPLEEDLALYLNKLEFPSHKNDVYQVWLNLARWFWRIFFLKVQCTFTLLLLSPLG